MERIVTSQGTVNMRNFQESYKKVEQYKVRRSRKTSLDIAERIAV